MKGGSSLTSGVANVDDGVSILYVLDHTADQSLGPVWGRVDRH